LEPEEEVATYARRVQSLVEGREVPIFSLLVAIVLILGGGGIYWFVKSNAESLAAERLSVVYAAYRKVLFPGATTTPVAMDPVVQAALSEKADGIAIVADEHSSGPTGALASYLAGNAYLRAGKPAEAIVHLEKALERMREGGEAWLIALEALGYALENAEQPEQALEVFTRLSESREPRFRLEGLLGRSRTYRELGRVEDAELARATAETEFLEGSPGAPPGLQVRTRETPGDATTGDSTDGSTP
jgi:tetratricopeptide (TPR) repeat protein